MSALSHAVCLSDTEVTADQYQSCVVAGVCQADFRPGLAAEPAATSPASSPGEDFAARCNGGQPGRGQYPINCVNFQQAQRYCEWRGERLPSDAEWTLAASRVGQGDTSVTDLLGSVSEWTSGSAPRRADDPAHGADARQVVLGAGLATGARAATLSGLYMNANAQGRRVGFRCARDLSANVAGSASAS
jgi:formylglycine-generating enzyme required for sulfatase activity